MRRLGLLAALALARGAQAGPLADLLRERRAARGDGDSEGELQNDGSSSGQAWQPPDTLAVDRNIAYGSNPAQKLDVIHRKDVSRSAPVLLMVHGGGWRRGDKGGPMMVKNKALHWVEKKGWVLVTVNYRLMPEANPVVQVEDIARALAFAQGKAAGWGGDADRFVVMGHSAGAHLVSLLTSDPGIAQRAGARPWLATIPIDSAAYDVEAIMNRRHYGLYDKAFGSDPQLWRDASPIHRLTGKPAAPMLLVCSSSRSDSCTPAQEYAAKANGLGGRVKVLPIEMNHGKINDQMGAPGVYTDQVDDFLRSVGLS